MHKPITKEIKKHKVWSFFRDNIWVADLVDMQFISKFIVIRGFLTPLFYKDPLYCLPHLFSKYCQLPDPLKLQYLLALFATFFLWLNGWLRHIWCVILLNDNMNLLMLSLDTLVPQEPCGVFYPTWYLFYLGLTHDLVFI